MWFGFSAENQQRLEEMAWDAQRIPQHRFISIEPILGPVDLTRVKPPWSSVTYDFTTGKRHWPMGDDHGGPRMSPGMSELERQYRAGEISHRANPLGRFCFDSVVVNPDGNENIKPMKNKAKGRIDPIVGLINAASAAIKLEQKRSVYEQRGIRTL